MRGSTTKTKRLKSPPNISKQQTSKSNFFVANQKKSNIVKNMFLAGSGHRHLGFGNMDFKSVINLAQKRLERYNPEIVISGMALGWDMALAQAAINLKIDLVCAVPYKGQEEKWRQQDQELYRDLLKRSQNVVTLSNHYHKGVFQKRNEWMVDQLEFEDDILLVYWDGSPGGTRNCIEYAKKNNKNIINVYPWKINNG